MQRVLDNLGQSHYGYNAATGAYEDLMEAGIIDPTKVGGFCGGFCSGFFGWWLVLVLVCVSQVVCAVCLLAQGSGLGGLRGCAGRIGPVLCTASLRVPCVKATL